MIQPAIKVELKNKCVHADLIFIILKHIYTTIIHEKCF